VGGSHAKVDPDTSRLVVIRRSEGPLITRLIVPAVAALLAEASVPLTVPMLARALGLRGEAEQRRVQRALERLRLTGRAMHVGRAPPGNGRGGPFLWVLL